MATQLTPQDLQFLSLMPQGSQAAGGINAFNQAAFANPVPANQPYGIVPTAPTGGIGDPIQAFNQGQQRAAQQQQAQQTQWAQQQVQQQTQQQQFLNMLKQQLGIGQPTIGQPTGGPPRESGGAPPTAGQTSRMAQAGGPHGATQGGPGVGSTAAKEALSNFERENVAVTPSVSSAIQLASAASGVTGMGIQLAKAALTDALKPDGLLGLAMQSALNVPGPQLSQIAMDEVTKAYYGALNPLATNIPQALAKASATLSVERALAGPSGHGQVNLNVGGNTPIGGWGVDASGAITGNFTSGLGARLVGAANFGGKGSTGGGLGGGGGPDTGGGLGGGVGHGMGSNRSM